MVTTVDVHRRWSTIDRFDAGVSIFISRHLSLSPRYRLPAPQTGILSIIYLSVHGREWFPAMQNPRVVPGICSRRWRFKRCMCRRPG